MLKKLDFFRYLSLNVKVWFVLSLLLGSYIRFVNLFNTGFYFDMIETQYEWGKNAWKLGLFGFWQNYPMQKLYDYPFISLIYEYLLTILTLPFGNSKEAFVFFLKFFNWIFEISFILLFSYLGVYFNQEIVDSSNVDKNLFIFSRPKLTVKKTTLNFVVWILGLLYILPSLWFVSAIWGQNDILLIGLTILCIYFLYEKKTVPSGLIFGTAVWIKQQPVLAIPVLALYFLYNKKLSDIFKILLVVIPFAFFKLLIDLYYNQSRNFPGNDFYSLINPLIPTLALVLACMWLVATLTKSDKWQELRRWLIGPVFVTSLINIPLLWINYERTRAVATATFVRADVVSNGATSFWHLLDIEGSGKQVIFNWGWVSINASSFGFAIYALVMAITVALVYKFEFNWLNGVKKLASLKLKTQKLLTNIIDQTVNKIFTKKLSFTEFCLIMAINGNFYFTFLTKMHSRYLNFGLLFSTLTILLLYKKLSKFQLFYILGLVLLIHFGFFLNQVLVFDNSILNYNFNSVFGNLSNPIWGRHLVEAFKFNPWQFSSLVTFIGVLLLVKEYWGILFKSKDL